ncbi:LysE family translocator [Streptomyces sp. NBC_00704]|uniref:LysE family translocator n=1 Tax=Streptomyces sp. NBC_00704 TaxID=2975809 RepID=UPI002E3561B3|nr:LysE family translocator [Streptomyces sp. NBC_00704]
MSVDLAGFLGVVLLAYLVPGPDFLVIVRAAARRAALGRAAALGAQTGLCVHMCAAALGLSALAAGSAFAFTAVRLAGAAYLTYLGVRVLLGDRRTPGGREGAAPETRVRRGAAPGSGHVRRDGAGTGSGTGTSANVPGGRRDSFVQGFLTNVLNPKAALFFLSVLPQFTPHGGAPAREVLLLGGLDIAVGVVYWLLLVRVAARLRSLPARPAWRRRWERTTGWLFIAVGVGVATAQ